MFFENMEIKTASKLEWFLAKLLGKKIISRDGDVVLACYQWRNHLYIEEVSSESRTWTEADRIAMPDYTDGSYAVYEKITTFRKAKNGDWE